MRKRPTSAGAIALVLMLALAGCAYQPPPAPYYPSPDYYPPPPAYKAPFLGPSGADAAPPY
ncbi:MAG TPA: hypothetical protein VF007_03305 [Stellaceae bacterium]